MDCDEAEVSIHAPARGATVCYAGRHKEWNVSIHAPARGATSSGCRASIHEGSFNPRPCTRGDTISIRPGDVHEGFNPRPCTRGDFLMTNTQPQAPPFQSTPLHEGRLKGPVQYADRLVSIHAPARGATPASSTGITTTSGFNPRPCTRGDGPDYVAQILAEGFNPRPCTRGDPLPAAGADRARGFNPRPCTRGDAGHTR